MMLSRGASTILAYDVLLNQPAVVNLADVLHEDRGTVDDLDRDIVEIVDGRRRRIGANGVLLVAHLCRARWQRQILRIHRVRDVERGQAFGHKLRRIDIDHDLAVFASGRGRQRDARNRRQLLAHPIDAVVVELLLVESVGAQADLQDRHA
jgi:hypothetical protein